MSKYNINEIVLSEFGFDKKLEKYKIKNIRPMNKHELDDIIDFKYEWNNKEQIYKDSYIYDLELCDNKLNKNEDEYNIFKKKNQQLTSQILYFNN